MSGRLNYFQTRPKLAKIDADAYLQRLGVSSSVPDLKYLRLLHRAHLLSIPFENLDIHYGRKIQLNISSIYKKVIGEKRGGLCYELNLLFYHLLHQLGFVVYLASARVFKEDELSPEYDHMMIFVILNDEFYLADVGFGSLFTEPKKIIGQQPQLDYTEYYRFVQDPDENHILQRSKDGSIYENVYQFNLVPREMITFLERCNYHQESSESYFRQTKLITQLFREGRITLTDRQLKMYWEGEKKEYPITSEDEFLARLTEYFNYDISALLSQQFR